MNGDEALPEERLGEQVEYGFRLRFDGPGVREGRMDARDLAASLTSLVDLIGDSQQRLDPEGDSMGVRVGAHGRGSYEVDLIILGGAMGTVVQEAIAMAYPDDHPLTPKGLYRIITNLIRLLIDLGDAEVVDTVHQEDGQVQIVQNDGMVKVVNQNVYHLYQDAKVRRDVEGVARPVIADQYDRLHLEDDEGDLEVAEEDWTALRAPIPEGFVSEVEYTTLVRVLSPAFDDGKWRLTDGTNRFYAAMNDETFKDRVQADEDSFSAHDTMQVVLRVEQVLDEDGGLSTRRSVERVIEHVPADRWQQLAIEDGDDVQDAQKGSPNHDVDVQYDLEFGLGADLSEESPDEDSPPKALGAGDEGRDQ